MDKPKMKPEYEIGDFVRVERYISLKAHTEDCYEYTGIVVSKRLKDKAVRTIYWFKDEHDYLVSVPEYGGDYVNVRGKMRHIYGYLKDFMFESNIILDKVSTLSGGQKNRLKLAKILANPKSCLILDEPTNDLDMETLDML